MGTLNLSTVVEQICGNSVPKQKEFCGDGKVIIFAVSLHNTKCCNLRVFMYLQVFMYSNQRT